MDIVAEIYIGIDRQGGIHLKGTIENKIAAYGLLELAKEHIRAYHEEQKQKQANLVQPAFGPILKKD